MWKQFVGVGFCGSQFVIYLVRSHDIEANIWLAAFVVLLSLTLKGITWNPPSK